jgi:hypothetical protein
MQFKNSLSTIEAFYLLTVHTSCYKHRFQIKLSINETQTQYGQISNKKGNIRVQIENYIIKFKSVQITESFDETSFMNSTLNSV